MKDPFKRVVLDSLKDMGLSPYAEDTNDLLIGQLISEKNFNVVEWRKIGIVMKNRPLKFFSFKTNTSSFTYLIPMVTVAMMWSIKLSFYS